MSHCGIYQWFAIAYNNLSKKCSFLFFCIICRFLQNLLLKPLSIYIDKQNIDNYHFHEFNFKKNLKTSNSNVNHQFIMIRSLDNILLPFATALLPPHHLSYHYLQFRLQLGWSEEAHDKVAGVFPLNLPFQIRQQHRARPPNTAPQQANSPKSLSSDTNRLQSSHRATALREHLISMPSWWFRSCRGSCRKTGSLKFVWACVRISEGFGEKLDRIGWKSLIWGRLLVNWSGIKGKVLLSLNVNMSLTKRKAKSQKKRGGSVNNDLSRF